MEKIYRFCAGLPRWAFVAVACVLYALVIYLGGKEGAVNALPGRGLESKIYHVVFYGGMGCFFWFICKRPAVLKIASLVMLVGALDEAHQYFLTFRDPAVTDVGIDTCAGLAAALLLRHLRARVALKDASNRTYHVRGIAE